MFSLYKDLLLVPFPDVTERVCRETNTSQPTITISCFRGPLTDNQGAIFYHARNQINFVSTVTGGYFDIYHQRRLMDERAKRIRVKEGGE